jgi:hypothetical protein
MPTQEIKWRLIGAIKNPYEKLPDNDPEGLYALKIARTDKDYIAFIKLRYQIIVQLMEHFGVNELSDLNGKIFATSSKHALPSMALDFLLKKGQSEHNFQSSNLPNSFSRRIRIFISVISSLTGMLKRLVLFFLKEITLQKGV